MRKVTTAIIGGGASGIVAAISARRAGKECVILERMPVLGKKILASGNGRCNLLNDNLDESFYNYEARPLVKSIFSKFGKKEALNFFHSLGLYTRYESERIFPATNQAATVLKILELELKKLGVLIELDFDCIRIEKSKDGFTLTSKNKAIFICRDIILAGGGRTYPALGSDGSSYGLAEGLGHKIIMPVPTCVPLVIKDNSLHRLQGQKIFAAARSFVDGKEAEYARGEVLFTKYGLSGSAILDISNSLSISINRKKSFQAEVSIDMAPYLTVSELESELSSRINKGTPKEDVLAGILPNKLCRELKDFSARKIKDWRLNVSATRGWNEAEFTSGGIDTEEVCSGTLESRICDNLYLAGEILNVNGKRGGYNLAWAWASGFVAGHGK